MCLANLYQNPMDAAPRFRALAVPDRLALPRLRPDDRARPRRSVIRLQFNPALVPVDDAFDIRVAFARRVLQPTEVHDMAASFEMLEACLAPLPERTLARHLSLGSRADVRRSSASAADLFR